jgi:hypothetical protein
VPPVIATLKGCALTLRDDAKRFDENATALALINLSPPMGTKEVPTGPLKRIVPPSVELVPVPALKLTL